MKITVITLISLTTLLYSCSSSESKNDIDDLISNMESQLEKELEAEPEIVEPQNWSYDSSFDKMEGDSTFFASTISSNKAQFDFPYEGGSSLILTLRKQPNNLDVYIRISKGQFNSTYHSSTVSVKFDDDDKQLFGIVESNSGSSDLMFLNSENKFVNRLKTAKTLLIQPDFYNHGSVTFEFDVSDLKWNH